MRRLIDWLLAVAWAAFIFSLSAQSNVPGPEVPGIDKVEHFGAYAVLGWLLVRAADRSALPLVVGLALAVLYGASDEIHQMFVPGRSPDVMDWVADAAGVIAATFVYTRLRARRTARRGAAGAGAPSLSA
ncbi:MAG TPA: VanZ family protein [Longimicrobium sp.]|nr:VanZ family protein [Longimicrobium sp.]